MKRDMEFIRKILLQIEAEDNISGHCNDIGVDAEHYSYQVHLAYEAGPVDGVEVQFDELEHQQKTGKGIQCWVRFPRLTWGGHEFLDASRDPTTWESAKKTLKDTGRDLSDVTLGVLTGLLVETTKRSLGLP